VTEVTGRAPPQYSSWSRAGSRITTLSAEVATIPRARRFRSARDDLPDGSDGIGELLLRHLRLERGIRPLLRGREVEEVGSDALLHRAECVDRDLLQGLVEPAAHLLGHGVGETDVTPRGISELARIDHEDALS
jgi:hypothetical protein